MTERKTAKPIECWAVMDKDGNFHPSFDVRRDKRVANLLCEEKNEDYPDRAPHRVARVVISEGEEPK